MLDRFTGLQVFARVAALGSLSGAARALGMSQSMATKHMAALEGRLGVRLLHRSTRRITLTEAEPPTSWNKANAREYGFYSNVNPQVSHPRWSQATELPIGEGLFAKRKPTLMFNGYGEEVAHLYEGMDLTKFY